MWYLRFRSSGKLARFYSSPTHHWMLFFFSACTWTSRTHNNLMILGTELSSGFPPQYLQISPNHQQHNNVDSQQNQNHFKNQPNLGWNLLKPNSHQYNAFSALYINTMNIILTIITMALLMFQVRRNRTRFRIGSNAVSHVAQSKSYVPLHI